MPMKIEEMHREEENIRRVQHVLMHNQDVLIRDMSTHFGLPLDGYTFLYPLTSSFAPHMIHRREMMVRLSLSLVTSLYALICLFEMTKGKSLNALLWAIV